MLSLQIALMLTDAVSPGVLLGPGDDAAVVAVASGSVVVTTDALVQGVHFRTDWAPAYDIGRRAAAASLADIAAMGARATAVLLGAPAAPADVEVAWAIRMADGLRDEAAEVGASVVGGDVARSRELAICVTALGDLEGRRRSLVRARGRAHRLDALLCPATRGSSRLLRPAAVAIHDDGDVARYGARLRNSRVELVNIRPPSDLGFLGLQSWSISAMCGR